jgi:hypothetical protein
MSLNVLVALKTYGGGYDVYPISNINTIRSENCKDILQCHVRPYLTLKHMRSLVWVSQCHKEGFKIT